jgi:hypothetical protein
MPNFDENRDDFFHIEAERQWQHQRAQQDFASGALNWRDYAAEKAWIEQSAAEDHKARLQRMGLRR